jgi:drug/metabolite transporter (DMT)-like permease
MASLPLPAPSLHDAHRREANRRGILAMSVGIASFTINDALVKFVAQTLPAAQLIFIRGVMATLLLLAVAHALGATRQMGACLRPRVVLRGLIDAVATILYLASLFHLPMANAVAINQSTPLMMTLFAVLFLGEKPGLARYMAIAIGFVGVLLVAQPSTGGFNGWALACLAGAVFQAARDLVTRTVDASIPSVLITLTTALTMTLVTGAGSVVQGWQPFSLRELSLLALASAFLAGGYFFIVLSMRTGEMSATAPFRYIALPVSVLLGFLLFGDIPNVLAWSGIALLAGSGLYVMHSERVQRMPPGPAASDQPPTAPR